MCIKNTFFFFFFINIVISKYSYTGGRGGAGKDYNNENTIIDVYTTFYYRIVRRGRGGIRIIATLTEKEILKTFGIRS